MKFILLFAFILLGISACKNIKTTFYEEEIGVKNCYTKIMWADLDKDGFRDANEPILQIEKGCFSNEEMEL